MPNVKNRYLRRQKVKICYFKRFKKIEKHVILGAKMSKPGHLRRQKGKKKPRYFRRQKVKICNFRHLKMGFKKKTYPFLLGAFWIGKTP